MPLLFVRVHGCFIYYSTPWWSDMYWDAESILDLFRVSIFSFPGGFFFLCEYWLFFPSPSEVQSWKIHGTSPQKSLWRTCKKVRAVSLNALSENNRNQLGHCCLSAVQRDECRSSDVPDQRPLVKQELKIISQPISGVSVMTAAGLRF